MPLWILFIALGILEARIIGKGPWLAARNVPEGGNSLVHTPLFIWILSLTFTLWLVDSLWNTVMPGGWSIQAEIAHYLAFPIIRKYDKSFLFKIWAVSYFVFFVRVVAALVVVATLGIGVATLAVGVAPFFVAPFFVVAVAVASAVFFGGIYNILL